MVKEPVKEDFIFGRRRRRRRRIAQLKRETNRLRDLANRNHRIAVYHYNRGQTLSSTVNSERRLKNAARRNANTLRTQVNRSSIMLNKKNRKIRRVRRKLNKQRQLNKFVKEDNLNLRILNDFTTETFDNDTMVSITDSLYSSSIGSTAALSVLVIGLLLGSYVVSKK